MNYIIEENTLDMIASKLERNSYRMKAPGIEEASSILAELKKVTFPGFFGDEDTKEVLVGLAHNLSIEIEKALTLDGQTGIKIEDEDASGSAERRMKIPDARRNLAEEMTRKFLIEIPKISQVLTEDIDGYMQRDPALRSREEVIMSYPGFLATLAYRYAHALRKTGVPHLPRLISEAAHSLTGIDINPGAEIGRRLFIDHGTGIVIGETAEIGDDVSIYHGVTLGAMNPAKGQSLAGVKRHPSIGSGVILYSNATVLGGETFVPAGSIVPGGAVIKEDSREKSRRKSDNNQENSASRRSA